MARVGAPAVVDVADVQSAVLPVWSVDLDASRRIVQPLDDLHHVGARVLLRPVDTSQLDVRPVDKVSVDGDAVGVDGGADQDLSSGAVHRHSLNHFADGVGEVQHVLVIIDRQTGGLKNKTHRIVKFKSLYYTNDEQI